ncbi:hypothetical protein [Nocardia sp. NPDC002869]|uniref:hypothetical protein n=1 Tax=Nocardia sp. NPDC002869 TaxID=3161032 RepID=UPI00398CA2F0
MPEHAITVDGGSGDTVRLDGATGPVLGAASAELFVVAAASGAETRWFVVDRMAAGLEVEVQDGADPGRDIGKIQFTSVAVDTPVALDTERAVAVVVALSAVEAAGVIRWCSDTATAYVTSRTGPGGRILRNRMRARAFHVGCPMSGVGRTGSVRRREQPRVRAGAALVCDDGVRGAVQGDDRHRPGRRAPCEIGQARDRRDGGDPIGRPAAQ